MQTQIRVWYGDITMQNGAYYDKFYKCSHCKGNLNFALSHIFKHIVTILGSIDFLAGLKDMILLLPWKYRVCTIFY